MYYKDILPYKLTPKLIELGWEATEDTLFIPWNYSRREELKFLAISRKQCKKGTTWLYGPSSGKQKLFDPYFDFGRDKPPIDDLDYGANTVFGYTERMGDLIGQICHVTISRKNDETRKYAEEIFQLIEQENCLYILKDQYFENQEFEKFKNLRSEVIKSFSSRYHIGNARRKLAKLLKIRFDLILRKNTHDIYIRDDETGNYTQITADELHTLVSEELGNELINDDDLKMALSYISDRLEPEHNIVRFKNCLFDMDRMETIQVDKTPLTIVESDYNYNPEAKSEILEEFLQTSLKNKNKTKTRNNIKCIKQLVGYLFTSGNKLNVLPFIIGISGGGKSVFANILTAIFGKDKIADLKLQQIEKDRHATSSLINKHLNIIQDSDTSTINNNSLIKQLTGNDSVQVNPKYKDPFVLPPEEVPKTILIANNIPKFTQLDQALVERLLIIEFKIKFRGTERENPNLLNDILSNPEEIEWFIYESLKEYKAMVENGDDFVLRENGVETRKLINKHQNPLNYIIGQLIPKYSEESTDYVYTQDLKNVLKYYAKEEGIDLVLNHEGDIASKELMNVIRNEFDLWDIYYTTQTHDGKRYYPHLRPNNLYWHILKYKLGNAKKDQQNT